MLKRELLKRMFKRELIISRTAYLWWPLVGVPLTYLNGVVPASLTVVEGQLETHNVECHLMSTNAEQPLHRQETKMIKNQLLKNVLPTVT